MKTYNISLLIYLLLALPIKGQEANCVNCWAANMINFQDVIVAIDDYQLRDSSLQKRIYYVDYKKNNDTSCLSIVAEKDPDYIMFTQKFPECFFIHESELVFVNTTSNLSFLDTAFLSNMLVEINKLDYSNLYVDWNKKVYSSTSSVKSDKGLYTPKIFTCKIFHNNIEYASTVNKELYPDEVKYVFKFVDFEFFDLR